MGVALEGMSGIVGGVEEAGFLLQSRGRPAQALASCAWATHRPAAMQARPWAAASEEGKTREPMPINQHWIAAHVVPATAPATGAA